MPAPRRKQPASQPASKPASQPASHQASRQASHSFFSATTYKAERVGALDRAESVGHHGEKVEDGLEGLEQRAKGGQDEHDAAEELLGRHHDRVDHALDRALDLVHHSLDRAEDVRDAGNCGHKFVHFGGLKL
jgi:hypothetical protein